MAIYFKGNKLVKGKSFMFENEKITYVDKKYGNYYIFETEDKVEYVLNDEDVSKLKESKNIKGKVVVEAQEDKDDLTQMLVYYVDNILKELGSTYTENFNFLKIQNLLQELLNKLNSIGYNYKTTLSAEKVDKEEIYNAIKSYFKEIDYNVSDTTIPGLYAIANNFILMINKISKEVNDGNME